MDLYDAIYTRQSVDRADSISVESQAEFCQKEVERGKEVRVYTDKGYSGKNTDRPAFQEMMKDVRAGIIRRVIVYRLDRISRSVLDFAGVVDCFQKHGVDFVSTMEKFDTSSPIGKAMLMIVMIFAQLERETIQQRVADAYASRSRRGFFMGGKTTYGFKLKDTVIDGVHTKMFEKRPEEAECVETVFRLYSDPQTSLGDVARALREKGMKNRDGKWFNRSRIRDMICNPCYTKSDYRIYRFFKDNGAVVENSPEEFIGTNGAYLYNTDQTTRKTICLEGCHLVLAPHEGLIDPEIWIQCRLKCMSNKAVAKPIKAKATWLAGKIKCPCCGYALTAKVSHRKTKKDKRYYLCCNQYGEGLCHFGSLDADVVDSIVLREMRKKLDEFGDLTAGESNVNNAELIRLESEIDAIDDEISGLMKKVAVANETVMDYINRRISELDQKKRSVQEKMAKLSTNQPAPTTRISGYMDKWDLLTMAEKLMVVDCLIEKIVPSKEKIEIYWKI